MSLLNKLYQMNLTVFLWIFNKFEIVFNVDLIEIYWYLSPDCTCISLSGQISIDLWILLGPFAYKHPTAGTYQTHLWLSFFRSYHTIDLVVKRLKIFSLSIKNETENVSWIFERDKICRRFIDTIISWRFVI